MSSLPLALVGPLASFGTGTHERYRDSALMPTKSAICGLVGACLGRDYADDQSDIQALKVHLRLDQPGELTTDFQTVAQTTQANGKVNSNNFIVRRQLLQDSATLVILEGERALLEQVCRALKDPHFLPYLGVRACVPSRPLYLEEVTEETPAELMQRLPWLGNRREGPPVVMETYFEDRTGTLTINDQPMRDSQTRLFIRRRVRVSRVTPAPHVA